MLSGVQLICWPPLQPHSLSLAYSITLSHDGEQTDWVLNTADLAGLGAKQAVLEPQGQHAQSCKRTLHVTQAQRHSSTITE